MGSAAVYRFGRFEMRSGEHLLLHRGVRVPLSPKAFDLLRLLVQHGGTLVPKAVILETLWPDTFVEETNLTVHVAAARKALAAHSRTTFIETVARRGYRFVAPVERIDQAQPAGSIAANRVRVTLRPLRTVGPVRDADFLAFSLPDAIAGSLAEHPWLVVRAPRAAAGRPGADLLSNASSGSVDAVLEGTLGEVSGEPRVRLNLVEAPAGTVLLSREFRADAADLFERQAGLARDVAQVLGARAGIQVVAPEDRRMPTSPAAYVSYLRATQLAYETSQWGQALALYEACLQDDPEFAPAWARLARCHRVLAKFGGLNSRPATDPQRALARAEAAFERALALDPDLPLTHSLYAQLEVDLGRAENAMVRLLALAGRRPNAPDLYGGLVHALRFCGLLDASIAAHEQARRLDPSVPTSVHHTWWMKGEYTKALAETFGDIGYMPGLALASLGNTTEAVAALRWRERECPDSGVAVYIASLRALLEGSHDECRRALALASAQPLDGEARYYLARTYARLGNVERAIEEMTRVVEDGFLCADAFARDRWLDAVRADQRFQRVHERARDASARAAQTYASAGGPALLRSG